MKSSSFDEKESKQSDERNMKESLLLKQKKLSGNKNRVMRKQSIEASIMRDELEGSKFPTQSSMPAPTKLEGRAAVFGYLKMMLLSYEFNIEDYLSDIDSEKHEEMKKVLNISPGYRPIRLVYGFYTHKYGISTGLLLALLYPLPYSLLFWLISMKYNVPFFMIFALAGMRSGALGIHIKYFLHLPSYNFQWIVFVFSIIFSLLVPNNYLFLLLYCITIFLSLFIKDELRNTVIDQSTDKLNNSYRYSDNVFNESTNFNEIQAYKIGIITQNLPKTYPSLSTGILVLSFLALFILEKFTDQREISILFQVTPLSLLPYSKQIITFFPQLFNQVIPESTIPAATLIAGSYLIPGPQIKVFMFLIYKTEPLKALITYLCLYLPSILICNIFIGNYEIFCSKTYFNIRQTLQAVSNALVFSLVIWMLSQEDCFFNTVLFTSVIVFAVAKLYRSRELAAISLGIFLVSARTIILHVNKGIPFETQACLPIPVDDLTT